MPRVRSRFHFPATVNLTSSPLQEAWLVLRWKLDVISENPPVKRDDYFPIALGKFDEQVKSKYQFRTQLPISQAPTELTPHIARFQFRNGGPEGWPLLQIGPGIVTVNFRSPCPWDSLKSEAVFLKDAVMSAYNDRPFELDSISLTYRSGVPFDCSSNSLRDFMRDNLNTEIVFPKNLPGRIASTGNMNELNLSTTFDLSEPTDSTGVLRIATGTRKENTTEEKLVIFDLEVNSKTNLPDIRDSDNYMAWLDQAHAVCHEWFMSLIEGDLYLHYAGKDESHE